MGDYRALYRKWRPTDFDAVCGQTKITDILKFQVAEKRIGHAYLFCGSRGTGKTSCAKILAKAVNCESPRGGNPCNECTACRAINAGSAVDVVEMDAASNTGVDNVRTLKEEIVFNPVDLKYKVYIIDEVHMISVSAFNALLKTLEEPPAHVIFILATTELHKLPTTIVSRCQRFDFRRINSRVIAEHLLHVSKEEGIDLHEDGARLIARTAQGGMRDALSLLELCAGLHCTIDEQMAIETLGIGSRQQTFEIVRAIFQKEYEKLFSVVAEQNALGRDTSVLVQDLIDCYRDLLIVKTIRESEGYLDVTDQEMATLKELVADIGAERLIAHSKLLEDALARMQRGITDKRSTLEIALCRMCDLRLSVDLESLVARVTALEGKISVLNSRQIPSQEANAVESSLSSVSESEIREQAKQPVVPDPAVAEKKEPPAQKNVARQLSYWSDVVDTLAATRPSNAGILSNSKAYADGKGNICVFAQNEIFAQIMTTAELFGAICSAVSEQEGRPIDRGNLKIGVLGKEKREDLIGELMRSVDGDN